MSEGIKKRAERLAVAARRYQAAVNGVFCKWDATTMGVLRGENVEQNCNYFVVEDLECCCCPAHVELEKATKELEVALAAVYRKDKGEEDE